MSAVNLKSAEESTQPEASVEDADLQHANDQQAE